MKYLKWAKPWENISKMKKIIISAKKVGHQFFYNLILRLKAKSSRFFKHKPILR